MDTTGTGAHEPDADEGTLETAFEMLPAATAETGRRTKASQRLDYRVVSGGVLAPVTDFLFIRSQMRRSLERSLADLRLEAERTGASGAPAA